MDETGVLVPVKRVGVGKITPGYEEAYRPKIAHRLKLRAKVTYWVVMPVGKYAQVGSIKAGSSLSVTVRVGLRFAYDSAKTRANQGRRTSPRTTTIVKADLTTYVTATQRPYNDDQDVSCEQCPIRLGELTDMVVFDSGNL